jgi:hypothetical protein
MRSRLLGLPGLFVAATLTAQPIGPEVRVNTFTTGDQIRPAVAATTGGGFVVVWNGPSPTGGPFDSDILGQRYSGAGARLGTEFRVNTYTSGGRSVAAVSSDSNGNFVVVWEGVGAGEAGSSYGIFGQRFSSAGVRLGQEFRVNAYTTGSQLNPSVASDAIGDFVVVWQGPGQTDAYGILGQRYAGSGAPLGGNFPVNSYTTDSQTLPGVASDAAGNFVVVWQSYFEDGDKPGIFAQRFASGGTTLGGPFRVNTVTSGNQVGPAVASDASGNFIVAWGGDGLGGYGVSFRRYSSTGAPLGPEGSLTASPHYNASVALDPTGDFVIGFDDLDNVYAQRYSSAGAPIGTSFRVNTHTTSVQSLSAVAVSGSTFVVTWYSNGQDGAGYGIYAQRFGSQPCAHGDVDASGTIGVADVFYLINALFAGGPAPVCSGDVNADAHVDVNDIFYLINFLFAGGPAPK